jgi:hypothetical protein
MTVGFLHDTLGCDLHAISVDAVGGWGAGYGGGFGGHYYWMYLRRAGGADGTMTEGPHFWAVSSVG